MTRVLLIGGSGQLGRVIRHMPGAAWRIESPPSTLLDVTNDAEVRRYVEAHPCDVILNCSAFTRVDDAESQLGDAERLNAHAPGVLAEAAARVGALFVHVSTDYVFDGSGQPPYAPDAPCRPLSAYGRTKLAGEMAAVAANARSIVVRTSWLHSGAANNFVARATQLLSSGRPMRVLSDQIGTPTRCDSLANALRLLIDRSAPPGIYHVSDAGAASWFDVAFAVRDELSRHVQLAPTATVTAISGRDFPQRATRPRVSVLDCHKTWDLLGITPVAWVEGVRQSVAERVAAQRADQPG